MTQRSVPRATTPPSIELVHQAAGVLEELKAEDVVALDLRELSSMCDYFLIASANSEQHLKALARELDRRLAAGGSNVWHREGEPGHRWLLLDFVDVVVHLFHREARSYYQLEKLWGDAARVTLEGDGERETP